MPAPLSFRQPSASPLALNDHELLTQLSWEAQAPKALVAAARTGDVVSFGRVARPLLREKRLVAPRKELLAAWSLDAVATTATEQALTILDRAPVSDARRPSIKAQRPWAERLQPLIDALLVSLPDPSVLDVLAALEILWTVGDRLPAATWWGLWRATLLHLLTAPAKPVPADATLDQQLIAEGEIPYLAGLVFGDIAGAVQWQRRGNKVLVRELSEHTDTDGTPHGELMARLPYWLAPLVRSTGWGRQAGLNLWNEDDAQLLSDICEKAVALSRDNGRLAFGAQVTAHATKMLQRAAELFAWPTSNPSRRYLRALGDQGRKTVHSDAIQVMPSNQSDWARVAYLRSDWSRGSASIAIAHHRPLPQLDISLEGSTLIHGPWNLDIHIGDASVELADEWSCVCWESQPEADYAELQMEGPRGMVVERLVLLSREDQFLMLADSISGAGSNALALRSQLRLAAGASLEWEAGTRVARVSQQRSRVRMLPLALPDDTVHSTRHRCDYADGVISLEQYADGHGMFAPLIFDFHPQRRRREASWRRLTVTEEGRVVPSHVAAAFRWKIGNEQWVVYRSLRTPTMPRAALGLHTANSFSIGRFGSTGDFDPILMVES